MRFAAALTVLLVLAAAAAGSASAASPTKREFIRRGDSLCMDVARQLVPIRRRAEAAKSLPEDRRWAAAARIWTDQIAIQKRFNANFRAIGVPAGDRSAARLVSGLERGVVLALRIRDGFAMRDTAELALSLPAYIDFTVALNARVRAYGFRACGRA